MWSNCCGAEPSYINDSLCGACLEHAEFDEEECQKTLTKKPRGIACIDNIKI